jgi:hypothetical protein
MPIASAQGCAGVKVRTRPPVMSVSIAAMPVVVLSLFFDSSVKELFQRGMAVG